MTPNGKTAIGCAYDGARNNTFTVFRWTRDTKMQPLLDLYSPINNPFIKEAFSPLTAVGVSWNGIVIIGQGQYRCKNTNKYYGYRFVAPKKCYF